MTADTEQKCQHDLLAPNPTVTVDPSDPFAAHCNVCDYKWRTRSATAPKCPIDGKHLDEGTRHACPHCYQQPAPAQSPTPQLLHADVSQETAYRLVMGTTPSPTPEREVNSIPDLIDYLTRLREAGPVVVHEDICVDTIAALERLQKLEAEVITLRTAYAIMSGVKP